MKLFCAFAALMLTGCVGYSTHTGGAVAGSNEVSVAKGQGDIESIQKRLDLLKLKAIPSLRYPLAKAQCWLDTALTQYSENDRTGYPDEALSESRQIVEAIEGGNSTRVGYSTPMIARSTKIRDDLWAQLDTHKSREATLVCNAHAVACAEISLVRAGHALDQTGWRQAAPYIRVTENSLRRAALEAEKCKASIGSVNPLGDALQVAEMKSN